MRNKKLSGLGKIVSSVLIGSIAFLPSGCGREKPEVTSSMYKQDRGTEEAFSWKDSERRSLIETLKRLENIWRIPVNLQNNGDLYGRSHYPESTDERDSAIGFNLTEQDYLWGFGMVSNLVSDIKRKRTGEDLSFNTNRIMGVYGLKKDGFLLQTAFGSDGFLVVDGNGNLLTGGIRGKLKQKDGQIFFFDKNTNEWVADSPLTPEGYEAIANSKWRGTGGIYDFISWYSSPQEDGRVRLNEDIVNSIRLSYILTHHINH